MASHNNTWEKRLTKLIYQNGDDIMSWETPYNDTPLNEIIKAFVGLLVTNSWDEDSVCDELVRYGIRHMQHPEEVYNILCDEGVTDTIDNEDTVETVETIYKHNPADGNWDPAG